MSDTEVEEEKTEEAESEKAVTEKEEKRALPKLDNVDDDLAGDRAAALDRKSVV